MVEGKEAREAEEGAEVEEVTRDKFRGEFFLVVKFSEVRHGWMIGEIGMRILVMH